MKLWHRGAPCVLCAAAVLSWWGHAEASQQRVTLSGASFSPPFVQVTQGDHVVWVWESGTHSVTSGIEPSETGDGIFNAPTRSAGASGLSTAFTWRADRTGTVYYFCYPHYNSGMTGSIVSEAPGTFTHVGDLRITEVQYTADGGLDRIEVANLGTRAADLGRYRVAISGDLANIATTSINVTSPGGRIVIHANTFGTDTPTDLFLQGLADLPDIAGSVALYAPNTYNTSLTDASQIVDFVQYGAGGQANEAAAVAAGLWTAGEFVPTVNDPARSIEFCGTRADHGAAHWAEIDPPNFGSNGACADRVGVPDPGAAREVALHPISPNPVSRGAIATFSLAKGARVRLDVLDVQGRVVASLADGALSAGLHSRTLELDGNRLFSPGLYFLRLDAGGVRRSQRFAVLQ